MARPTSLLSCEAYMFSPPLDKGCDGILFDYFFEYTDFGHWIKGNLKNNVHCLESIHRRIHSCSYSSILKCFSLEDLVSRLSQWHHRFHLFSFIITHPHVDYRHHLSNLAPRAMHLIWSKLSGVCPEVLNYKETGETNWPTLKAMFRAPVSPYCGRSPIPSLRTTLSYVDPALLGCFDADSTNSGSDISSYPSLGLWVGRMILDRR